jgi:predicted nicotinamide N-methyase
MLSTNQTEEEETGELGEQMCNYGILPFDDLIPDQSETVCGQKQWMGRNGDGILLEEDASIGCGGRAWEAADVLCAYLDDRLSVEPDWLDGRRVLELGSGTGLVGLYALYRAGPWPERCIDKQSGVRELILTDLPAVVGLLERNVLMNGLRGLVDSALVRVEPLIWGPSPTTWHHLPDVVLISDCVYLESCFQPLLDTLAWLLVGGTSCIMAYKKRRRAEKRFFVALRKRFQVMQVRVDESFSADPHRRMMRDVASTPAL